MSVSAEELYGGDDEQATEDSLERLAAAVERQLDLEQQIADAEENLKRLNKDLLQVAEIDIPAILDETGLSEVRLSDGTKVVVEETLRVSTTGQYRAKINAWLKEHGLEDMIRDELTLAYRPGQDEEVQRALQALAEIDAPTPNRKEYVNAASFSALMREMRSNGEDVPYTDLGVQVVRRANLQAPK